MRNIVVLSTALVSLSASAFAVNLGIPKTPLSQKSVCSRGFAENAANLVQKASFTAENPELTSMHDVSREERVDIMCQLKTAMERKYALIDLKKNLVGLDGRAHLEACARHEAEVNSNERGAFLDRVRVCLAAFQDSHLYLGVRVSAPGVFTAIGGELVEGKLLLTYSHPRLIALLKHRDGNDLKKLLTPGTEIVEIDGQKPADAIARMSAYQSASTPANRLADAARSLFERDYSYPQKNFVSLKVRGANGAISNEIRLPWWSSDVTNVPWANALLERAGITPALQIQRDYDAQKGEWKADDLETEGYVPSTPLFDVKKSRLAVYKGDKGKTAARMGMTVAGGKGLCYLQLLTFHTEKLKLGDEEAKPYLAVMEEFIADCEEREAPLVLDLRKNPGGNGRLAAPLLALLAGKDVKTTAALRAVRISAGAAEVLGSFFSDSDGLNSADELVAREKLVQESFTTNLRAGKAYSDIIARPDEDAGLPEGFNQKVVALITPDCISACDITAALIKANKRGVLIGTHSNGTGAGFWSKHEDDANFNDSYGILKIEIPNFLFGVNKTVGRDRYSFEEGEPLLMENRPIQADVQYATTLEDVTKQNAGWLKKVLEQLN